MAHGDPSGMSEGFLGQVVLKAKLAERTTTVRRWTS